MQFDNFCICSPHKLSDNFERRIGRTECWSYWNKGGFQLVLGVKVIPSAILQYCLRIDIFLRSLVSSFSDGTSRGLWVDRWWFFYIFSGQIKQFFNLWDKVFLLNANLEFLLMVPAISFLIYERPFLDDYLSVVKRVQLREGKPWLLVLPMYRLFNFLNAMK